MAALPEESPSAKGTAGRRFRTLAKIDFMRLVFANAAGGIAPQEAPVDVERTFLFFFI
jgi:hypothetical protein